MREEPMSQGALKRTCALFAIGATGSLAAVVAPASSAVAVPEAKEPKNVIVMISDGAGYNQFDIANLFETGTTQNQVTVDPATGSVVKSQSKDTQVYDSWPVQVAQSHYSANGRAAYSPEEAWGDFTWVASGATDSAAAGTALGTGVKTNNGILGHTPDGEELLTVGEQAMEVGKKVGLVTSVNFNHATPAGFIAHNTDRNDFSGLATEMIDSGVDVIMGAGHPNYTNDHTTRSSNYSGISKADFDRLSNGQTDFEFIDQKRSFEKLAAGENVPEKVFGLAQVADTLQNYRAGRNTNKNVLPWSDPRNDVADLDTMTEGALNVLENDEDGFFLMVEGGAVDWAGHDNSTTRVIEEQQDFNAAVESVNTWVEENSSWDETLVVVTADHETGYLAGAGAKPTWTPMTGEAGKLPNVTWNSGGHTNALVPLFAKGAGSQEIKDRATKYDQVRGAYLDNTDLGKTVFDFLGHAEVEGANQVGLEARVPYAAPAGVLELGVAGGGATQLFSGIGSVLEAVLPDVTVTDTRNELQATGEGWTVSGTAQDFVAGNRTIDAANLAWTPRVVSSESGASAGPAATLEGPAQLADSTRESRVGRTVLSADLDLSVPAEAESGTYGSEITLTLFAKD
jgi:alkaline phosphatase